MALLGGPMRARGSASTRLFCMTLLFVTFCFPFVLDKTAAQPSAANSRAAFDEASRTLQLEKLQRESEKLKRESEKLDAETKTLAQSAERQRLELSRLERESEKLTAEAESI